MLSNPENEIDYDLPGPPSNTIVLDIVPVAEWLDFMLINQIVDTRTYSLL